MSTLSAPVTLRTVPPSLTVVNTLFRVSTRGERLSAYLLAKTGGRNGWQAALVRKSGVKRQTITKWTREDFDGYPDMAALDQVAGALGVNLSEIVAALNGEPASVTLDEATREAMRAELVVLLPELLEGLGLKLPRRRPPEGADAT